MSIPPESQRQLCPSVSQMELSLLANTQQEPDASTAIRQLFPQSSDDTVPCFSCKKSATGKDENEVAAYVFTNGSASLWAHPSCATKHNEDLYSACRLASAVKTAMPGYYLQGVDPSEKGTFVCAVGRGRHTVDVENRVRQISSTTVTGRQERACDSCVGSIPVYADSVGKAFSTATLEASGSVLLFGIEASPGNKQVVRVPWESATELHKYSHRTACTAATCNMAAFTDAVAQRRA